MNTSSSLPSSSTFGYHTTTPVDRNQRNMLKNRDRREAAMITGTAPLSTNPIASLPTSAGYVPEAERLKTQAESSLRSQRKQDVERHSKMIDSLRGTRQERETTRQKNMSEEYEKALRDGASLAGTSLRNNASVPYNLVNHNFTSEDARKKAVYDDQWTKHSFMMRTQKLEKALNPAGYNIINGMDRSKIAIPPRPAPLS